MERVDVAVIGAGVVGLSVAAHASKQGRGLLVLERHDSFGQESSSRNSEVIHASIYYPPDSLKGRLCLEGNELIYALCRDHGIPCSNMGKLIVAVTEEEESRLPALLETARGNGAKGVRLVDREEVRALEPNVAARAAIHCPSSGVVDSHALMKHFETRALSRGAAAAYGVEVTLIEKTAEGLVVGVKERRGAAYAFLAKVVVNCAGLAAGRVAAMAGIDQDQAGYRIHYRKGMYFRVMRGLEKLPRMLIYPTPPSEATVGIHTCPDLAGGMRLGPYDVWIDEPEYSVDPSLQAFFFDRVRGFLPTLSLEDIQSDMAGIQAKSYGPGEPAKDFIIRHEEDKGLPGLINLIGIESPGLTSSPAIGRMVAAMVDEILA
jgi:L-2-hydroxyglutarate oxidase LhgO